MDLLQLRYNRSTPNLFEQFKKSVSTRDISISKSSDDLLLHLRKDSRPPAPPRAGSSNAVIQSIAPRSTFVPAASTNATQLWFRYSPRDEVYEPDPERMMDTVLGRLLLDPGSPLDARYNQMILHIFESYRVMKRELAQTKTNYLRALTDYDKAIQNDAREIETYINEIQRLKGELKQALSRETAPQRWHLSSNGDKGKLCDPSYANHIDTSNPSHENSYPIAMSTSADNGVKHADRCNSNNCTHTVIFTTPPRRNEKDVVFSAQKRRHRDVAIHTITPSDSTTTFGNPVSHDEEDRATSPIIHYGDEDEDSAAEKSLPPTPTSQFAFARMKHELGSSTNIYYPLRHHRTLSDPVVGSVEDMNDAIEDLITSYHRDSTAPSSRHSYADARTSRSESFKLDIFGWTPSAPEPVVAQTQTSRNRPRSIFNGLRDGLRLHPVAKARRLNLSFGHNNNGSMMRAESDNANESEVSHNVGGGAKQPLTRKSNEVNGWHNKVTTKDKKRGGIWRNNIFWHSESNY